MSTKIKSAMILSAGLGRRMGELTSNQPKPTIEIYGKSFIHRILDMLIDYGVDNVVINSHYHADKLLDHIKLYEKLDKIKIDFLYEPVLLETAGGIMNAIDFLEGEDFFVLNGDVLFADATLPQLKLLEMNYDAYDMDALILLHHKDKVFGYYGKGDFDLYDQNKNQGPLLDANAEKHFIHTGLYIMNKKFFSGQPKGYKKMMDLFQTLKHDDGTFDRIYGVVNDGYCLHVGDRKAFYELPEFLKNNNIELQEDCDD